MSVILDYIVGLLLYFLSFVTSFISGAAYKIVGLEQGSELANAVVDMSEADLGGTVLGNQLMSNFFSSFPVFTSIFDVFLLLAHLIVISLVVIGMVKALFGPFAKTGENPIVLATRGAFASFLIKYSAIIAGIFLHIGSLLFIEFQSVVPAEEVLEALNSVSKLDTGADIIGGLALGAGASLMPGSGFYALAIGLLVIVLLVGLISNYVKLVLEIIERYITMCFLAIVSPLFIGCLASASTTRYFFGWTKMMFSQAVLLGFSSLWLNVINYTLAHSMQGGTESMIRTIGWMGLILLITAFTIMGTKIDRHMATLGFSVAQGGDFGNSVFAAYAATKALTRSGTQAVSKATSSKIRANSGLGGHSGPLGNITNRDVKKGGGAAAVMKENLNAGAPGANKGGGVNFDLDKNGSSVFHTADEAGHTNGVAVLSQNAEGVEVGKDKDGNPIYMESSEGKTTEMLTGSAETGDGKDILDDMTDNADFIEDDTNHVGFTNDDGDDLSGIIGGDFEEQTQMTGDELRDYINDGDMNLQSGDSLVALSAVEDDNGDHTVLGSYTLGNDSFDDQGNLKTFDYNSETGEYSLNEDGQGSYFMDSEGNYKSFDEVAEGGLVAVSSGDHNWGDNFNLDDADSYVEGDREAYVSTLTGDQLRDNLAEYNFSDGDTLTSADIYEDDLGHEILGSYELGANSLDNDGKLMTFDYDEDTGQYTYNESGQGDYFLDKNGDAISFDDVAAGGIVAVGTGTDGAFFMTEDGQQHELASKSVISDGEGGLYQEVRDKDTGRAYMSSFDADVKNGDNIVTTDAMERVVDKDNLADIKSSFTEAKSAETIGSMESRNALTPEMEFSFNDKDLTPEERRKFEGRRFSFTDKVERGHGNFEDTIRGGAINGESNGKVRIKDDLGNEYDMDARKIRRATPVNTVDSAMRNKTLSGSSNQGVKFTDKNGIERRMQFTDKSIKDGQLMATDSLGNPLGRAAREGDSVKMYDTAEKRERVVDYNDVKKGYVGNFSHDYKGMNVTHDGKVKASDISYVKNRGKYQEIGMKDGSTSRRTESKFVNEDNLGKSKNKAIKYTSGSNYQRQGSEKIQFTERGQFEGRYHGRPSGTPGFKDYSSSDARRMASQLKEQKDFNPNNVKTMTTNNKRGISVVQMKSGESYAIIDKSKNPEFKYTGTNKVSRALNKHDSEQMIISFGKNSNPADIRNYLDATMKRTRNTSREVIDDINKAASNRYLYNLQDKNKDVANKKKKK